MTSKPTVASVRWDLMEVNSDESATVYKAQNYDFYQVLLEGKRVKYFYGESAEADYQRWIQDNHTHNTRCQCSKFIAVFA